MSKTKAADALFGEWITDRLPTKDDADRTGYIWCTDMYGDTVVTPWDAFSFETSIAWMPRVLPEPYQPPKPDTSLAASIEQMEQYFAGEGEYSSQIAAHPFYADDDDWKRIIEAARKSVSLEIELDEYKDDAQKWRKHISNAAVQTPTNDPVGENENVHTGANSGIDRCLQPTDSGVQDIRETGNQGTGLRPDVKESANRKTERSQGLGEVHEHSLNDQDGVGDGWMLCDHREAEQYTHIANAESKNRINGEIRGWLPVCGNDFSGQSSTFLFRRRIDADCKVNPFSSRGCQRGTKGCDVDHDADKPTEQPKRREFFIDPECRGHINVSEITDTGFHSRYEIHVREVLPSDPSPEWVDELVRLCQTLAECWNSWLPNRDVCKEISNHLSKRGEK